MSVRSDDPLSISVVIVNWNAEAALEECLSSLRAQTLQDFEIVVVDNGSSDGSLTMLSERFAEVVVIETHENLGFAKAANLGIARAMGQWIATLNNDTVADPRWLEQLRAAAASAGPDLGMLQSYMGFRDEPRRINSTGMVIFDNATAADRGFGQATEPGAWSSDIFCPTAGAALYRRAMLEQVQLASGVFDGTFFMYFEDADLGWRCRLAGWSARYVPEAVVHHAFQGSSRRHGDRFVPLQCRRNRLQTLAKNASRSLILRSSHKSLDDLWWILRRCGPRALFDTLRLVRHAFQQRAAVTRIVRHERSDIERAWLGRQ